MMRQLAWHRLLLALLITVSCAACLGRPADGRTLTVLTPWTGTTEQDDFNLVLERFKAETGITVKAEPTRAVDPVLQGDIQKGDVPDLAVLSSPGLLDSYAGQGYLIPLDQAGGSLANRLRSDFGPVWSDLAQAGTGRPYAVVVKASVKSLIWYDPRRIGTQNPVDFAALQRLDTRLAQGGATPWCLGVADDPPTSGWPGTDWIEDILLHQSGPAAYAAWVNGTLPWDSPQVQSAWQTWGNLVLGAGQLHGGTLTALLTNFGTSDVPLFSNPPGCLLSHGALVQPESDEQAGKPAGQAGQLTAGTDYEFFPFPSMTAGAAPDYEVSGDFMTVLRDSSAAQRFVAFLASADGQRIWPGKQPDQVFSADRQVAAAVNGSHGGNTVGSQLQALLTGPGATLCFDASDAMPPAMSSAFNQAVLEYLQNQQQLGAILHQLEIVRSGAYDSKAPHDFRCEPAT